MTPLAKHEAQMDITLSYYFPEGAPMRLEALILKATAMAVINQILNQTLKDGLARHQNSQI